MRNIIALLLVFFFFQNLSSQQDPRIYINEFLASNVATDADIVDFDDYSDWIELYNDESSDVDIGGYFLTDNFSNPTRWQIPSGTVIKAKGFLRFWADGYDDVPGHTYRRDYSPNDYFTTKYYHLNFSLSRASEEIGLFKSDGTLIDSVSFGFQLPDVSVGRKPDGYANWLYFGEPTPEASNITEGTLNTEFSADPDISLESGFYNGIQLITITATHPSTTIKYTLDGSKPCSLSETYLNPISINQTVVLQVRAFEQNKLPSNIITKSYFIDENILLPVISLVVQPDVLWDNTYGIYDNNFKEREIPVSFEFIDANGTPGFKLNAGLRLTGQASLFYPQKSFTISTDDRFGTDEIIYRVFPQRELNTFKSLYLRNSGVPDNRSTFFRDAMQHSLLINKIDLDCQAYRPSVLFLNGEYWGIYNIRDKIDKDYIFSLHNVNPDDVDLLEYNMIPTPEVMEGNAENYNAFYNYIRNNDLSVEQNYRYIGEWMDVDEYINYQICEIFFDNVFWPDQNIRMWRERKEGAKWRWILHDLDYGFGMPNQISIGYRNNTLEYATSSNTGGSFVPPLWSTLIFRKLLENNEFKVKFVQHFSSYLNSIFHPDTILAVINQLQGNISKEMPRHISRWRNGEYYYGYPIQNYSEWLSNVNGMREFAGNRQVYQRQHIADYFGLSGTSTITVNIDNQNAGKVLINNVELINESNTGIYFKDIPIVLKAIPEVGYRFVQWVGTANEYQNPITFMITEDTISITAQFETVSVNLIPSVISVNTTLQRINSPYYAASNVKIDSSVILTVESGVEILMPENASILVNGKLVIDGTKDNPVIIQPNEQSDNWGALCIVNSTDSCVISNLKVIGATKGIDFTRDMAAVSSFNSNVSLDGIVVENVQMPIFIQLGNVAVKNCTLYSKSSGDLINIKQANFALVENCDLMGNDEFDSDGIDFDHISSGIIRGNRIYNIYGFNSDAIDLGEDAQNILIENNIIYNVNDKGVSIGGGSTAEIKRNVIANCGMGVGIKDYFSYGYMENNTFYGNQYGIASFEKNIGHGGGSADVVNCIIANSKASSLFVDPLSYINVSYSLSNTDELKGPHNIYSDPLFINNLYLSFSSPAINGGDPSHPYDPDGTIADMGAYPFDQYKQMNLIINEIHYNPINGENYKFVEVVNAGNSSININNFKFSSDIVYQFSNDTIAAGEYFIIAKDKSIYEGNGYKVFQWQSGDLLNSTGNLFLYDDKANLVDFVNYDSKYWWPKEPDGLGPSLKLQNVSLENVVSSSWRSSYSNGGSPGKSNNSYQLSNLFINEFLASNSNFNKDENGDYDDWIELYNNNDFSVNVGGLFVTDNLNNPCKYQIPFYDASKTTINAKGHLLLWADGEIDQGILHLSFKLDKAGEQVGIAQVSDNDTLIIDSLTYAEQQNDISYGRFPDGSTNWIYFNSPTPSDSNKIVTGVVDKEELPASFSLSQNYPNPFNPATKIQYTLPVISKVELRVYDVLGREIATLVNENQRPGKYEVEWKPASGIQNIASGIYFYRLTAGSYTTTKKMILLK
jgi:hypothetical protein